MKIGILQHFWVIKCNILTLFLKKFCKKFGGKMKTIILTGGGSGGHIIPNIALLPYLKAHFDNIYYLGEAGGMEEKIAKKHNIEFYPIQAIKLDRSKMLKNLKIPFVLPRYISQAVELLQKLKADVVFSKGGYVSLPITYACKRLGIPYVIHEADQSLGVANKLAAKNAKSIITSDKKCNKNEKYITLGTPIRDEILHGNPSKIVAKFQLDKTKPTILVVGGSLGAKAINDCITACADTLTKKYNIIHLTGKGKMPDLRLNGYYPIEYVDNIGDYYALANLVIARAGAGVITELQAIGVRSILIPLPQTASRGDQIENAKKSNFFVIKQEELTPELLCNQITRSLSSPKPQSNYDLMTSQKIVERILLSMKK